MFGMSAAEVTILLIVGIVVVGPQKLPAMMRGAGKWIAKLRRMSTDLRAQSGIDKILREEGLEKEIRDLRALHQSLSKQAVFDTLVNAVNKPVLPARPMAAQKKPSEPAALETATKEPKLLAATPDATPEAEPSAEVTAPAAKAESSTPLIRPAEGTVARGEDPPEPTPVVVKNPYDSFRELEYPYLGPDHYDAMPDDFEEEEEEARLEAEAAAAEAEAAAAVATSGSTKGADDAEPREGMAE